jgi:hypothetical protein
VRLRRPPGPAPWPRTGLEARRGAGDDDVGVGEHGEARAHRGAVDGGHDRLRKSDQLVEERVEGPAGVLPRLEVADVGPGREHVAGGRQQQGVEAVVDRDAAERVGAGGPHGRGEGVLRVGPLDGEHREGGVGLLDEDEPVGGHVSRRWAGASR